MRAIALPFTVPRRRALPGFGLSLGLTLFYLASLVLVPLLALVLKPWSLGLDGVWTAIASPRVLAALRLSFGTALAAAVIDSAFGIVIAWVLVRYRFPGKGLLDAMIDLPFALPGLTISQIWHPRMDADGGHKWLRGLIFAAFRS